MSEFAILLVLAVPVLLWAVFVFFWSKKRARLKPKDSKRLADEIDRLEWRAAGERIVGYDKVLDHLLSALGYKGTLGEKLKREPALLRGRLEEVWKLHKIRNRIVHDLEPVPWIETHAERYRKVLLELLTQ